MIELIRKALLDKEFKDETSPYDGVTYPTICKDIPEWVKKEFTEQVEATMGEALEASTIVARLNLKGTVNPTGVHSDLGMGDYTALLYLTLPENCEGGTRIVKHVTGYEYPINFKPVLDMFDRDSKIPEQWETVQFFEMGYGKLVVFPSPLFHIAEPAEGFGDTKENGRLVLVGFFKVKK